MWGRPVRPVPRCYTGINDHAGRALAMLAAEFVCVVLDGGVDVLGVPRRGQAELKFGSGSCGTKND